MKFTKHIITISVGVITTLIAALLLSIVIGETIVFSIENRSKQNQFVINIKNNSNFTIGVKDVTIDAMPIKAKLLVEPEKYQQDGYHVVLMLKQIFDQIQVEDRFQNNIYIDQGETTKILLSSKIFAGDYVVTESIVTIKFNYEPKHWLLNNLYKLKNTESIEYFSCTNDECLRVSKEAANTNSTELSFAIPPKRNGQVVTFLEKTVKTK